MGRRADRGFSITELLVTGIVVGLLASTLARAFARGRGMIGTACDQAAATRVIETELEDFLRRRTFGSEEYAGPAPPYGDVRKSDIPETNAWKEARVLSDRGTPEDPLDDLTAKIGVWAEERTDEGIPGTPSTPVERVTMILVWRDRLDAKDRWLRLETDRYE